MSRELLEKAAKAAGITVVQVFPWSDEMRAPPGDGTIGRVWNPLADDGDALRLAVRCAQMYGWKTFMKRWLLAMMNQGGSLNDHTLATRHAIVRAAAAMGEKP